MADEEAGGSNRPVSSFKCRLGNWREEVAEHDASRMYFQAKKASGELLIIKKLQRLNESLQPTVLSCSTDGWIHFGQHVMLMNQRTGIMWVCLYVRGRGNDETSNILRYGDTFRLRLHPALCKHPPDGPDGTNELFLYSEALSPLASSRCSRNQEVVLAATVSGGTLWKVLHVDARVRYEHEGRPVPANAAVVIKHVHTDQMLASAKVNYITTFGSEYEVHCKSYLLHNKTQNLLAESHGKTTSDIDSRAQDEENNWKFVLFIRPNSTTPSTPDEKRTHPTTSSAAV